MDTACSLSVSSQASRSSAQAIIKSSYLASVSWIPSLLNEKKFADKFLSAGSWCSPARRDEKRL